MGKVLESLCGLDNVFDLLQHFQSCALSILNPNRASKSASFTYLATWMTDSWPGQPGLCRKGGFLRKGSCGSLFLFSLSSWPSPRMLHCTMHVWTYIQVCVYCRSVPGSCLRPWITKSLINNTKLINS